MTQPSLIEIVSYRPAWPAEFLSLAAPMRQALGLLALRIDHIGSTSVPGLAAKDIIDIQVTVQGLTQEVERALNRIGYQRVERITHDHLPPGGSALESDWQKWFFRPPADHRRVNLHVRVQGCANQRYPLLFRDYLRAHPHMAEAYARVKVALAKYHADDIEAYLDVKDPVCDIIMGGAEDWAAATHWALGPSDC
jgi:GrpB-like predicted nucleotidyltransferase (UPF0157 family)